MRMMMMVKVCRYRKDTLPHQKRCKKYGIAKLKDYLTLL